MNGHKIDVEGHEIDVEGSGEGVVITSGLQAPLAVIDSLYYGKFVLAPLNILWYNVFRRGGGPDLYGKTSLMPRPHRERPSQLSHEWT